MVLDEATQESSWRYSTGDRLTIILHMFFRTAGSHRSGFDQKDGCRIGGASHPGKQSAGFEAKAPIRDAHKMTIAKTDSGFCVANMWREFRCDVTVSDLGTARVQAVRFHACATCRVAR